MNMKQINHQKIFLPEAMNQSSMIRAGRMHQQMSNLALANEQKK
jgi:hypothetical protein